MAGAALVAPDQVVPLRDEVAERAAVVAERDAAVHAAAGLAPELAALLLLVDLFPVHECARATGRRWRQLALWDLEEPLRISHRSPP